MSAAHKNITLWSKCFVCKYPPSKQYFNNLLYLSFWNLNGCPWAWFHRETDDIRTNCFHGFQDKLKESTPLKSLVFWNIVLSRYNTDKGWMLPPPPKLVTSYQNNFSWKLVLYTIFRPCTITIHRYSYL